MTAGLGPLAVDGGGPSFLSSIGLALCLVAGPALAGGGDAQRGEQLYVARCGACHSIDDNGAGPRHRGLFGRKAATQPGFNYSEALKKSGIVWTDATLDRWLANPNEMVPGNIMAVQLANDPKDRRDILAYLKAATAAKRGP